MTSPSSSSLSPYGLTDWRVSYNLSERCGVTRFQNSPSIALTTVRDEKSGSEYITGFTITTTGEFEEEVKRRTNKLAKRLAHIISIKSGKYVTPILDGHSVRKDPERRPDTERWSHVKDLIAVYNIENDIDELDLTDNTIDLILQNDGDINQQLHHASLAIGAEKVRQYENMIREFFQIIEKDKNIPDYYKWKALRDALSHQKPVSHAKSEVENYFCVGHFDFTNDEFDHDSQKNIEHVMLEASNFKK